MHYSAIKLLQLLALSDQIALLNVILIHALLQVKISAIKC